jgi:hypothetical protein
MGWFHAELAQLLEEFLSDVIAGRSPRLMLFAPPQHGKSELVSRRFPAYVLGREPWLRIIATSYGASLAFDLSSDVQAIMDGDLYHRLFPSVVIPGQHAPRGTAIRRIDNFGIVGHPGSYRAAGVDGAVTGKSAEIYWLMIPSRIISRRTRCPFATASGRTSPPRYGRGYKMAAGS